VQYIRNLRKHDMADGISIEAATQENRYVKIGFFSLPIFWANLFFGFLAVAGHVGQKVALPLWVDATNSMSSEFKVDSYFVVSFASLLFVIIFGLGTLYLIVFKPGTIGETERKFPQTLLAQVGIFDGMNGIIVVFACSGTRTAPYLQAILGNFIIPLTILIRYIMLRKRPTLRKFICGILVVVGLFICLLPSIFPSMSHDSSGGPDGATGIGKVLWPICFMLGFVPAALMNVIQEKSLKLQTRGAGNGVNIIYFLFTTSVYQLLTVGLLFWTDIIPQFGYVKNINDFGRSYWFGLRCFFGGANCSPATGMRGMAFIAMYIMSYYGAANLLRYAEGATWLAIVISLVTPLAFLFWTLFEESPFKWHPVAHVGTWCSIFGLALMIPAIYFYNTGPPEVTVEMDHVNNGIHQHPIDNSMEDTGIEDDDSKPLLY